MLFDYYLCAIPSSHLLSRLLNSRGGKSCQVYLHARVRIPFHFYSRTAITRCYSVFCGIVREVGNGPCRVRCRDFKKCILCHHWARESFVQCHQPNVNKLLECFLLFSCASSWGLTKNGSKIQGCFANWQYVTLLMVSHSPCSTWDNNCC